MKRFITVVAFVVGSAWLLGVATPASAAIIKGVVTWTDNSTNETAFKIDRKTGVGGTYVNVGQVGANIVTFTDDNAGAGLALNTSFCYRVSATNNGLDSAPAAELCATTPNGPAAPSGVGVQYIIQ